MDCPNNDNDEISKQIYCILSYHGSSKDIIINYTLDLPINSIDRDK